MKLPKFSKSEKSHNTQASTNFFAVDLTDHSVKVLHFVKNNESFYDVDGVSFRSVKLPTGKLAKAEFQDAFKECSLQANANNKQVILGLSGPKVFGFVMIAKLKRQTPDEIISDDEVQDLYNRVKNSADIQAKKRWQVISPLDDELVPLDVVVTSTHVDGSSVEEPAGMKGSEIKVSVYCSYAFKEYYKWAIEQVYSVKGELMAVTTAEYSLSRIINEKNKNYILVDVGSRYTDISVIFGGDIIQTRSFEIGGNFFTKNLADKMSFDTKTAELKKESFSDHSLPEDESFEIGDFLYDAGKIWRESFSAVLNSFTGVKSFPSTIYLTGGGSLISVIQELIAEDEWRKEIPFAQDVEVFVCDNNYWKNNINDKLMMLTNTQMFPAISIGLIELELNDG